MESLNHQIAHEILHSYQHNKEATYLYQTGFLKAANIKLQQCEIHINKAFELIAQAMTAPNVRHPIITAEELRKKIPYKISVVNVMQPALISNASCET
jgi:hypothetical protein